MNESISRGPTFSSTFFSSCFLVYVDTKRCCAFDTISPFRRHLLATFFTNREGAGRIRVQCLCLGKQPAIRGGEMPIRFSVGKMPGAKAN